jgi:2-(1,2-epoxy-1,2-dihydrophenyl)acetyl-CoA isomerase
MAKLGRSNQVEERYAAWEQMMLADDVLTVDRNGSIATVTIKYPRRGNAIIPPLYLMLPEALTELSGDDEVRVIILTGTGRNFSSGGYVGPDSFYVGLDAGESGTLPDLMRRTIKEMAHPIFWALDNVEQPVICMLNGRVMDFAIDIALACDIRTGHGGSEWWFEVARVGESNGTGGPWMLPRVCGIAKAMEFLLLAKRISGKEAYDAGLLNFLFEESDLNAQTMRIAERMASLPPVSLRVIKQELKQGQFQPTLATMLQIGSAYETITQATQDHMDAEAAIVERREPIVRGS